MVDFKAMLAASKERAAKALNDAVEKSKEQIPATQEIKPKGFKLNLGGGQKPAASSPPVDVAGRAEGTSPAPAGGSANGVAVEPPAVIIDAASYNHPSQPEQFTAEQAQQFKEALSVLHNSFDQKELVGKAIQHALEILKKNPEFKKILAPEDVGLMVRALRQSYGFAVSATSEKKAKKQTKAAKVDEVSNMLGDISFDL